MRLEVRNIGKIDYANVKLDGMTVLVGSNSTGKSTISKSLYTIIRGFHNFDGSLEAEKNRRIIKCLRNWTRQMYEKIPRIIKKDEIRRNTENHIPSLIEELRKIKDRKERDYYEKDYDGIRNCFNSFNIGCNKPNINRGKD